MQFIIRLVSVKVFGLNLESIVSNQDLYWDFLHKMNVLR